MDNRANVVSVWFQGFPALAESSPTSEVAHSMERNAVRRSSSPWLILAAAAVAAFVSGPTGDEVGIRLMLLLTAAAIVAAIQGLKVSS